MMRFIRRQRPLISWLLALTMIAFQTNPGWADPISFTSSYTQDFQSITATNLTAAATTLNAMQEISAQNGGGALTGWYMYGSGSVIRWGRTDGTSNSGSIFGMFDSAATPGRALGSQSSASNVLQWGVVLQNTSGATINNISIAYDAVMNRNPSTTVNPYPLSYLLSSTTPVGATGSGAGTFNDLAGTWNTSTLGFSTPAAGSGTGAPGTQTPITPLFKISTISGNLSGLNWAANDFLFLRWSDADNSGADSTAGVDNFSINAIAAGANLTWNLASGGIWNIAGAANWTAGAGPTTFANGDAVTFDNSAGGTIDLSGTLLPTSVNISATGGTYTFLGATAADKLSGGTALLKSGPGTLVVASANDFTGGTTITGGTVQIDGGNRLGTGGISINGGTLTNTAAGAITLPNGVLIGATGGAINNGGQIMTFNGTSAINGTLTTTGSGSVGFLTAGTSFGATGSLNIGTGGSITLGGTVGTLIMASGGVFNGDLNVASNTFRLQLDNATYGGTGKINMLGSTVGAGNGGVPIVGGSLANFNGTITNSNTAVTAGTVTSEIVLNPANSGAITGHVAWTPGNITNATYTPGSFLAFLGGTTGGFTVTVNAPISGEGDLFIGNSSKVGGGSGNLALNASSTYQGNTLINSNNSTISLGINNALPTTTNVIFGSLSGSGNTSLDLNGNNQQIASLSDDAAKPGTANLTITNNATSTASTLTISGSVTPGSAVSAGNVNPFIGAINDGFGTVALTKAGTNSLALNGVSNYSGPTTVNGGKLVVGSTGMLGNTQVTVNSGGTLGGTGILAGTVTLAGGTIDPGDVANTAGTLNVGGLSLGGGTLAFQLGASTDVIAILTGGTVDITSLTNFSFTNLGSFVAGDYSLITNISNIGSLSLANLNPGTLSGFNLTLNKSGSDIVLNAVAAGAAKVWTGAVNVQWNTTAANWSVNPFQSGDNVSFNDTGNNTSISVTEPVTAGTITVDNTTKAYQFSGSPITANSLIKSGTNTLTLSNANSISTNVNLNAGTLRLGDNGAMGSATLVLNGGTLEAFTAARTLTNAVSVTADSTIGGTLDVTLSGTMNLNSGTRAINVTNTGLTTFSNSIASGGLNKTGPGTLVLSGTNSYVGGTTFTAGEVRVASDGNLGGASGGLFFEGGTLKTTAGITSARAVTVNAGGAFDTNGFDSTLSGAFSGAGTFTKAGAGTLTLSGANSVPTGPLAIAAGSVALSQVPSFTANLAGDAVGGTWVGDFVVNNAIRVNFNSGVFSGGGQIKILTSGSLITNSNASPGGTIGNVIALNVNSVAQPFVTTIGATTGGTLTLNAAITGASDVNIANNSASGGGAGTTILGAVSNYTGATTFNANNGAQGGTVLAINNPLPVATDVTFGTQTGHNAARLDLNGFNLQIGSLSSGANAPTTSVIINNGAGSSTLTVGGATSPVAFQGAIIDGGSSVALAKSGSGTLTLAGANTYTGPTTVSGGTLAITGSLGNTAVAVNGGALGGSGTIAGSVAVNIGGSIFGGTTALNPGTLTVGSLAFNNGGAYNWGVTNLTTSVGLINLTGGGLDLSGLTNANGFTLNLNSFGGTIAGFTNTSNTSFTLVQGTSAITGFNAANFLINSTSFTAGNVGSSFNVSVGGAGNTDLMLNYVAGLGSTSLVWVGDTGNWTATGGTSWSGGAWNTTQTAVFSNPPAGTVTLQNHIDAVGLQFDIDGYIVAGSGANTLSLTGTGGPIAVANGSHTATVSAEIAGGNPLTKSGLGKLVLSGPNSYTGATSVTSGVLNVRNNSGLGTGSAAVTVDSGAALELQGNISLSGKPLNLSGMGVSSGGALRNIQDSNTFSGAINLNAPSRINSDAGLLTLSSGINATAQNLTFGGAGNIAVTSAIALTSGSVIKDGAGTVTLSTANTYSGGTAINGGVLSISNDNQLGSGGGVSFDGGTLTTSAAITSSRAITLNAAGGTINTGGFDSSLNSVFSGAGGLTKAGAGTLPLTSTTAPAMIGVSGGNLNFSPTAGTTLNTSASSTAGTFVGNVVLGTGSRLNFMGGSVTGGGQVQTQVTGSTIAGTGTAQTTTIGNIIALNTLSAAAPFSTNIGATAGNTLNITGGITGGSDVNFAAGNTGGAGFVILSAASSYTGSTTLSQAASGVVRLGATNALPTTTAVVFGSAAINVGAIDLNGFNQTIASLASNTTGNVNGIANTAGTQSTLTIDGSATSSYKGSIGVPANVTNLAGANDDIALTLASTNSGSLTLTGTSTYTGATTINGGALVVDGSLTNSAVTVNGGTLGGTGTIAGTVTLAAGGKIDPGAVLVAPVGTLNVGNLALTGGTLQFQMQGTSSDKIQLSGGGVNITGATVFSFIDLGAFGAGTYNLVSGYGSLTGIGNLTAPPTLSGFNLTLGSDANNIFITATVAASAKTWTGATNATWDTTTSNWTPAPFTFSNNDNPLFDNTGTSKDITVAGGGVQIGTMTVNNTDAYRFSGGPIGGSGSLMKDSSGLLTLDSANTYAGGTTLNANGGTIAVGHNSALGTGTVNLNGGALQASGAARSLANSISVGGNFAISGSLDLTLAGNMNLNAATRTVTVDNSASTTFSGTISNGGLTKAGAGTLVLSGTNDYAGGTTINGGVLSVAGDGNLGAAAGGITFGGGTLLTSAGVTSARAIVVGAGGGTINTSGVDSTLSGTFNNSGAFTKSGAGNLTVSGAWTSTGTVAVTGGTLTLGQATGTVNLAADAGGGTFTGNLAMTNAIRVNFNSGVFSGGGQILVGATASSLANTGTAVSATINNDIVLNNGNLPAPFVTNIGATSGNAITINGTISGAADVNLSVGSSGGAGILTLNAANTYTGATTISKSAAGVVRLGIDNALPTTTALTFGSVALNVGAVDLNGRNQTLAALASNTTGTVNGIANTSASLSTLTINGAATTTFKGTIGIPANVTNLAGANDNIALVLASTNTGSLTLTGANTYTGGTSIFGGTLALGSSTTLADTGAVLVAGGILDVGVNHETIGALTVTGGAVNGTGTLTVSSLNFQAGAINASIAGAAAPNKTTGGTTTLGSASTFTGQTTISAGTLLVTANGALGATGAGNGTVVNGGTLELGAGLSYSAAETVDINGNAGGLGALRLASGSGSFAGGVNAVTDATIFSATGATLTLSGPITKNGTTLTLTGGGRIVTTGGIGGALANSDLVVDGVIHDLSGTNTYNGPTTIQNSGTLNLLNSNALPNSPDPLTNMTITGAGSSFNLNGFSDSVASLNGSGTVTNTTGTASNLTVSPSSGTTTFSGSITGGANMSVTKSGGGTQVLSGTSTYTGATNINGGTLLVAAGGSLSSTGAVNVNAGGTLAGAGSVGNITINSGATVAPAPGTGAVSAPGNLTATSITLMGGGIFNLQVNDALGGAGTGWDQLQLNSGTANIASLTPGNQFIVNLSSLTIGNTPGTPANFNSAVAYTWDFLNYGSLSGTFASNLFNLNTGAFSGSAGTFSIINNISNTALAVQYTPSVAAVPEPGSLLLTALASLGMAGYGYRRRRRAASETSDENGATSNE